MSYLVVIGSSNPDLSYLLNKNPESPPKKVSSKSKTGTGYFKDGKYIIEITSLVDSEEFLDSVKYTDPSLGVFAASSFLKINDSYDTPGLYSITFSNVSNVNLWNTFKFYYPECSDLEAGYKIEGSTFRKCLDLFNLYNQLNFAKLNNKNTSLDKVLSLIHNLKVPYYIRKVARRLFNNPIPFNTQDIRFSSVTYLDKERFKFISKFLLPSTKLILDYGCGEDRPNSRKFEKSNQFEVVSMDVGSVCNKNYRIVNSSTWLDYVEALKMTVLCTEVLEHIEPDKVGDTLRLLSRLKADQYIITLPIKAFNKYFPNTGEFRHPDHKWEWEEGVLDFSHWFPEYSIKQHYLGDCVNNEYPTIGWVINHV